MGAVMALTDSLDGLAVLVQADARSEIENWLDRHNEAWKVYLDQWPADSKEHLALIEPFTPQELSDGREFWQSRIFPPAKRSVRLGVLAVSKLPRARQVEWVNNGGKVAMTNGEVADAIAALLADDNHLYRRVSYAVAQVRRHDARERPSKA